MTNIRMQDVAKQLSQLLDAAERGAVITIFREGKPAARLVAPVNLPNAGNGWSAAVTQHVQQSTGYDESAFMLDRSDLPPTPERDLF